MKERGRRVTQKRCDNAHRSKSDAITSFDDGRRPQAKEYSHPLETGKGKEADSLLEPLGTQP